MNKIAIYPIQMSYTVGLIIFNIKIKKLTWLLTTDFATILETYLKKNATLKKHKIGRFE